MTQTRPSSPWGDGSLATLTRLRPNVANLSERAEAAVLAPLEPGAWPAAWRIEIAARICDLNGQPNRAERYRASSMYGVESNAIPPIASVFAEKVAAEPRAVTAADVEALSAAGFSDADIVRLCELVAFVSYQCRVEAGHALLGSAA